MMVTSPIMKPSTPKKGKKHGDDSKKGKRGLDNSSTLSPLPSSRWDSPPNSIMNRSPPTPSSSQRKLFEPNQEENIENDTHVVVSKRRCSKRGAGRKETHDATSMKPSLIAAKSSSAAINFSEIFSESKSSSISTRTKKVHVGPRLSRRPSKPVLDYGTSLPPKSPPKLSIRSSPMSAKKKKVPKLSPRKEPTLSPLHPPRVCTNNPDLSFNDFTMTPTILYGQASHGGGNSNNNHRPLMQAPMSATSTRQPQHYHQSPHWSGQVRVNPFSPVPEQYLRPPPTSTKSVSRGTNQGRYNRPGCYPWMGSFPETLVGPPALPVGGDNVVLLPQMRRTKKARSNPVAIPRLDDSSPDKFREISPIDVTQQHSKLESFGENKRKATKPPPQSMPESSHKRMRIKRGRYLDDFQEVEFLGAGSFGSVNACLSRLDGCMYAVKSISPAGRRLKGNNADIAGVGGGEGPPGTLSGAGYLYGGQRMISNQCSIPPTPRPLSPLKRRKAKSRFGGAGSVDELNLGIMSGSDGYGMDLDVLEGSSHWNDGALRRMLREVFALAALCQKDDFRTFHIVRYQQAWLEDDGTLYIQTELCSATLRDELSGKAAKDAGKNDGSIRTVEPSNNPSSSPATKKMDVFRQLKLLREVLLALALVHQQGMVHLDIKPENIMVKNDNDLYKLGDFGLANVFTKSEEKAGAVASTPDIEEGDSRYMSKDLLDFNPKNLTKCDIFSLGATMYEVCSGQPLPLCGQEWQDLRNGKVPPLPGTMPALNAIIREMMHPDPKKRPSATELLSREILSGDKNGNSLLGSPW
eukprot:CAMPEP_0183747186 /NCGR_PEP_ID=MMETSP0737-20130205/67137_1 /TAXON_ID=385413 /ORGANISM="Thalassiosira miniscula, Strain CCMP1093" /LENGTH=804 /DNA_ID=CAMNT_0025982895 /DNA_START=182 /DNA_END=2593 /DNA_ORIENTATION=+